MCGIAGMIGRGASAGTVRRMTDAIAHRGPDDAGIEPLGASADPMAVFGHRRLSILDLSPAGHQPMWSHDRRWCIVFNGEIYNFASLRERLEESGARFRSGSDTEVLLEGFAREGAAFLHRLRGMYAFALWDSRDECVYLARDPFGIKPLYHGDRDGALVFASEVRALLASGEMSSRIAPEAVRAYLEWGSVPEPLTMFPGVRMLEAGVCVRVDVRRGRATAPREVVRVTAFEERAPDPMNAATAASRVREALRDSIAHHLVSDVDVALFLSGGIDSSAVVALASEVAAGPLQTFNISFAEQAFDESDHAATIARRFRTEHHRIGITADDLLEAVPDAFAAMDQPSMDGLNTYVVSRAVRQAGLKVVLSGLGGDELFAGYPSFRRARSAAALWRLPLVRYGVGRAGSHAGLRGEKAALLFGASDPASGAYAASRTLFTRNYVAALASAHAASPWLSDAGRGVLSPLQRVSMLELTGYMRNTLLRDSDVFSMANALELRVPFVDRVVAQAAMSIPDHLKLSRGRTKPLIVDALGELLPRSIWDRPKQGFLLPFDRWMRGPLRDDVARVLTSESRLARVGVSATAVAGVWNGFERGERGMSWSRPWALYTLVRWAEQLDAWSEAPVGAYSPALVEV